jgi:PAS domain S-box-containing protein
MASPTPPTHQWIRLFAGISALVICLQAATFGLVQYFGKVEARHINTLQLADEQILLFEQFERASYLVVIGLANEDWNLVLEQRRAAEERAKQFQSVGNALRQGVPALVGDRTVSATKLSNPVALRSLDRIDALWVEVQAAQVRMLRSKNFELARNPSIDELRRSAVALLDETRQLRAQLRLDFAADVRWMRGLQTAVPVLGVLTTLVLAALVLGKLVLPLRRTLDELRTSRAALQRAHDELEERVEVRTRELAETNQVLRDQSDVLESVLDSMAEGVVVVGSDGTFRVWNAEAERIVGIPPAALECGRWLEACPSFHADGRPFERHELPFERALASEAASAEMLVKTQARPDGAADGAADGIWLSWAARPLTTARGELRGAVAVFRDDTPRKQAEARLLQSHEKLEQRVIERTRALRETQRQLVATALAAGKAEVATNILHNVGNVLTSVNVLAHLVQERLQVRSWHGLPKLAALIAEHREDLGRFLTEDDRGKRLPEYVQQLATHQTSVRTGLIDSVGRLLEHIEHIKRIVVLQQEHARSVSLREDATLVDVIDDALSINQAALARHGIEIVRDYQVTPTIHTHKHKLLQILTNLVSNAKYALSQIERTERRLIVRMTQPTEERVRIEVIDNGCGIPSELLTRIFQHGFTTRPGGHGFGLHASVLAANELDGSLHAYSDGPGTGARFTLEIATRAKSAAEAASGDASGAAPGAAPGAAIDDASGEPPAAERTPAP